MIPNIIHQIWMQGWSNLPDKFAENVRLLEEKNPGYTHIRWDESMLRLECAALGPECLKKFDSFKYMVQKVEFGRYVVAYRYGGVTVDLDMKSIGSIDSTPGLHEHEFMVSQAAYPFGACGGINNALLIVSKEHPTLKAIIDTIVSEHLDERDFLVKELYIHATTGPQFFTRMVRAHRDSIHVLSHEYYEPCMSVDPFCSVKPHTIMDHQHELSWMSPFFKFVTQIVFFLLYSPWILVAFIFAVYWWSNKNLSTLPLPLQQV